jgi:MoxR-like ATPase
MLKEITKMIPKPFLNKKSDNPRFILQEKGIDGIAADLAEVGYVIPESLRDDFSEVLKSGKPWLIEGLAGTGKTTITYALRRRYNLAMFKLQGMSGLTKDDLLARWDITAQNQFVIQSVNTGKMSLEEAQAAQYAIQFLKLGEPLRAFHWASVHQDCPIFLLDEVDKMPENFQDMLLELFESGFACIDNYDKPIGIFDSETGKTSRSMWPLVVLTSNTIRHKLSEPFRSRCFCSFVDEPSPEDLSLILHKQVPAASPEMVLAVMKISESIKTITGVKKKPGPRELVDLLQAFSRDQISYLDEFILRRYVGYLAKHPEHRLSLRRNLALVENELNERDDLITGWVWNAFNVTNSLSTVA